MSGVVSVAAVSVRIDTDASSGSGEEGDEGEEPEADILKKGGPGLFYYIIDRQ